MERTRSNKAAELICSYLLHEQTDADKRELDSWLSESRNNQLYFSCVTTPDMLEYILRRRALFNIDTGCSIWNRITREISQSRPSSSPRRHKWFRI